MTKVRAFINIIAEGVDGKPVSIKHNEVADIKITEAVQEAIDEGYAELANKTAVVNATPGGLKKAKTVRKTVAVSPQKVARDIAEAKTKNAGKKGRAKADRFSDIQEANNED